MPHARWSGLVRAAWDLLLPGACAACHGAHRSSRGVIVCLSCQARLRPLALPQCRRCGHPRLSQVLPSPPGGSAQVAMELPTCRWCERLHPGIRCVRSAARMEDGSASGLVYALKYHGWQQVSPVMAKAMARVDWPLDVRLERAALIPIPLASARRRERGYNQAELLAQALASHWDQPVWSDVLIRIRETASQVRLTPSQRMGNVSRAFATVPATARRLQGQHLVLVDDVVTTAATLNAAAQALLDGGARIVSCITFGRAPDPGDRTVPDYDFSRN